MNVLYFVIFLLGFELVFAQQVSFTNGGTTEDPEIALAIQQIFNLGGNNNSNNNNNPPFVSNQNSNNNDNNNNFNSGTTVNFDNLPPLTPRPSKKCDLCVPYYLCDPETKTVIKDGVQDGFGMIDIRGSYFTRRGVNQCDHYLEVCCKPDPNDATSGNEIATSIPTTSTTPYIAPKQPPTCGTRNSNGLGFRITGNRDNEAEFGEFPWMLEILLKNSGETNAVCSGSLIHPQVVLTGAHCVKRFENSPNEILVRAGEWDTQTTNEALPYQERDVDLIIAHEQFDPYNLYNNVAVMLLNQPFNYADNVGTICLPPRRQRFSNARCYASGWGKDIFGKTGRYQTILKKIDVPRVPFNKCENMLRRTRLGPQFVLDDTFTCAGGEEGKDACKGDGGGPLACPRQDGQYEQIGIISWGIGCGMRDVPGVYADVSKLRDWIDLNLGKWGIYL